MAFRSLLQTAERHAARLSGFTARTLTQSRAASSKEHPKPLYFYAPGTKRVISPWHDIPLAAANARGNPAIVNFVCEIPRASTAKFEISTDSPWNPIIQDKTKKGEPRHYALPSLVNYGALPGTYEDPRHVDTRAKAKGDGDPLDACDISTAFNGRAGAGVVTGGVYSVKVLGALAMLDGGEADWKLLVVRTDDPLAARVDDIRTAPDDVKATADAIREWFRTYKIPEGKGENSFAFNGAWLDAATALDIIAETVTQYQRVLENVRKAPTSGDELPWVTPAGHTSAYTAAHAADGPVVRLDTSVAPPEGK